MTSGSRARFQKLATVRTAPQLYSWGTQALYIGPAFGLSPHRNSVAVIALALECPFDVALDPADDSAGYRRCSSVLIPPNTLHHLANTVGAMAFLYIDAGRRELQRLSALASSRSSRADFDLHVEASLIDTLRQLASGAVGWRETKVRLSNVLAGPPKPAIDHRVRSVLDRLRSDPATRVSLAGLAREVHLSESRFLHLFKTETGVPLRRYKLWIAMRTALSAIAQGTNLTTAAMSAGFSSSAHFSAAFREMFGLEPSRLMRAQFKSRQRSVAR